ncbi:MAG: hypothetical protein II857_02280 [Selenomonadaceae bacterium]|nr:hypothetical protein [Selenomonadaceae bacterium]
MPEKGFAEIADSGAMIIVNQMCGEFKFWREVAEKLSQRCGYKVVGKDTCFITWEVAADEV